MSSWAKREMQLFVKRYYLGMLHKISLFERCRSISYEYPIFMWNVIMDKMPLEAPTWIVERLSVLQQYILYGRQIIA